MEFKDAENAMQAVTATNNTHILISLHSFITSTLICEVFQGRRIFTVFSLDNAAKRKLAESRANFRRGLAAANTKKSNFEARMSYLAKFGKATPGRSTKNTSKRSKHNGAKSKPPNNTDTRSITKTTKATKATKATSSKNTKKPKKSNGRNNTNKKIKR